MNDDAKELSDLTLEEIEAMGYELEPALDGEEFDETQEYGYEQHSAD